MAVEGLRRRVHHEIRAERERLRVDRRGHRRIRDEARTRGVRDLCRRRDVDDVPGRVGRRLDPHEGGGAFRDGGADETEVGRVDEHELDIPGRTPVGEPRPEPVVYRPRRDDASPRLHERLHGGGGGGHPRSEELGVGAVLELGEQRLRDAIGGIVLTRVGVPTRKAVLRVPGVGRARV